MANTLSADVIAFFDSHPINEDEILAKLAARGDDLEALTQDALKDFDQDHYGGTDAVNALAEAAAIGASHHVLDVCSGMGGPTRWLAQRHGCRVTGIDFTASRVEGARSLTRRVGLDARVDFQQGDATAMPFADASFDALISQESWCHIAAKAALISECIRVLKPGGKMAFTDIVTLAPLEPEDERRLRAGMAIPPLASVADYTGLLEQGGCRITQSIDLSPDWVDILIKRLEMYRSLKDTTVAKFGLERFHQYDRAYSHFVSLFERRVLGGVRIAATKA